MSHNAERDWSGRSYRKGGERVRDLRDAAEVKSWREGGKFPTFTEVEVDPLPENKLAPDRFGREMQYFCESGWFTVIEPFGTVPIYGYCW